MTKQLNTKLKNTTVRIPEDHRQQMMAIASQEGLVEADIIRRAVRLYLENYSRSRVLH